MSNEIEISFHVTNIPCPEEYYMGVNASYNAYSVFIPRDAFPKELLDVIDNGEKNKAITSIAIHRQ